MIFKYLFHGFRITQYLLCIFSELWCQCFAKGDCLRCYRMHMWTSLETRKYGLVDLFGDLFTFSYEDESSSWSTQCLMCRRCDDVESIIKWIFESLSCNQSCYMRHISHSDSADFPCYFDEFCIIELS